ncbi:MAG: hypothetical protein PUK79_08355 [Clostridiales bacterium]|nr:hypothetical protein [Clostridiales bacterium]
MDSLLENFTSAKRGFAFFIIAVECSSVPTFFSSARTSRISQTSVAHPNYRFYIADVS